MSSYTDVSAWICYLFIAFIGATVSYYHVNSKLPGAKILWIRPELWVVYILYTSTPMILFWLLDATGEVKDTSLLWAVSIALIYRKILSGENDQVHTPNILSGYWVSLENLIEKLINNWGEQVHRHKQWQHRAVKRLLSEVKGQAFEQLIDFAGRLGLTESPEFTELQNNTSDMPNKKQMSALTEKIYTEAMRRYHNDIPNIFIEERILSYWVVLLRCKFQIRDIVNTSMFIGVLFSIVLTVAQHVMSESFHPEVDYYVWRIGKTNSSDKDLHRTNRSLVNLFQDDHTSTNKNQYIFNALLSKIYAVDISPERAENIAHLFIELNHQILDKEKFINKYAEVLRSQRFEIRVIVHNNLLFLTRSFKWKIPQELINADVAKELSMKETEMIIMLWQSVK